MNGIVGIKKGMTQIYNKNDNVVPCTVIDVSDTYIVGKKTTNRDGYKAVIVGKGKKKKAKKAELGKYKKLKFVPRFVSEFRVSDEEDITKYQVGDKVGVKNIKVGDKVNVTGITKGKGFQGVVKRWRFKGGSRTHGQSDRERAPGSIGGGTDPGRVYKGKKMPGHMGDKTKTVKNVEIVKVDSRNSLICLKGAVPGSNNAFIKIKLIRNSV